MCFTRHKAVNWLNVMSEAERKASQRAMKAAGYFYASSWLPESLRQQWEELARKAKEKVEND